MSMPEEYIKAATLAGLEKENQPQWLRKNNNQFRKCTS